MKRVFEKTLSIALSGAAVFTISGCFGTGGVVTEYAAGEQIEDSVPVEAQTCLEALGYGTITLANGSIWLDRNLGAGEVAGGDVNNSASFGDYYQWGRGNDGHEKLTSGTVEIFATQIEPLAGSAWDGNFIVDPDGWDWLEDGVDNNGSLRSTQWGTPRPDSATADEALSQICPCGFVVPSAKDFSDANLTTIAQELDLPYASMRDGSTGLRDEGNVGVSGFYRTRDTIDAGLPTLVVSSENDDKIWSYAFEPVHAATVRCIKKESSVDSPPIEYTPTSAQ